MADQAVGSRNRLIFDQESVYGSTPGVPDAQVWNYLTHGVAMSRNFTSSMILRNNRNAVKPKRGLISVGGPVNCELNPFMGTQLKHTLGSAATAGAGANKTHTLKVGDLPVGLCIEDGQTDINQYFLWNGCRIKKADFEFGVEGVIPASFEIVGQKETLSGASFDATPVDWGHDPFDGAEMSIEEGGGAIANVSKLTLSIENDLDEGVYCIGGGGLRRALPAGGTLVTGVVTALFEDPTLYNKAINYTESSIKVLLARGLADGTAGNESLETLIPELIYKPKTPPVDGPKGRLVVLEFVGFYENSAEATSIQMILKNTQATI